jgi:hypothetical protein
MASSVSFGEEPACRALACAHISPGATSTRKRVRNGLMPRTPSRQTEISSSATLVVIRGFYRRWSFFSNPEALH